MIECFITDAWAQVPEVGAPQSGAGLAVSFVPFIAIFVLFYFLLIMPQQKKAKQRKQMVDALKKGDRVMTSGGMIGTVTTLSPKVVSLQVAEGTRIKVNRTYVEEVLVSAEPDEE
ncbi:MAG: preprotein translocase subunit YajC [Nitrospirae bacterium]|nr:preprotein translocase subunit YajC [Candidatus Troglogloeales bacterium]